MKQQHKFLFYSSLRYCPEPHISDTSKTHFHQAYECQNDVHDDTTHEITTYALVLLELSWIALLVVSRGCLTAWLSIPLLSVPWLTLIILGRLLCWLLYRLLVSTLISRLLPRLLICRLCLSSICEFDLGWGEEWILGFFFHYYK